MNKLIAGSYKTGEITGDTHLTLTGSGSNLIFNSSTGEIWGGCTGDYYSISDEGVRTYVNTGTKSEKNRILTFSGFTGELNCTKIRGFNQAEFKGNTAVTLNNGGVYNFSDIENWTFECGSSVDGNFANSFKGDTLTLTGIEDFSSYATNGELTIMENSRGSSAFAGFGGESGDMTVKFYLNADDTTGTAMTWQSGGYYAGGGYYLKLDDMDSPTKMMLTNTLA